jgi:hypothetical protein
MLLKKGAFGVGYGLECVQRETRRSSDVPYCEMGEEST